MGAKPYIPGLIEEAKLVAEFGVDVLTTVTTYPLESFIHTVEAPVAVQDNVKAILDPRNMHITCMKFYLLEHDGKHAHYAAPCPRCNDELIEVTADLDKTGRFVDWPAVPSLCMACEDALDAILEGYIAKKITGHSVP